VGLLALSTPLRDGVCLSGLHSRGSAYNEDMLMCLQLGPVREGTYKAVKEPVYLDKHV
jgi:hypothetical protein